MVKSNLLSRDAILAISDIQYETVPVPEWGGEVRVRGLTAAERDQYESSFVAIKGKNASTNMSNARARLVVMSVVDDSGERIFANSDIPVLGAKSAAAMDRIYSVASRLSGVTDADIEELAGNSDGQSDGSNSD